MTILTEKSIVVHSESKRQNKVENGAGNIALDGSTRTIPLFRRDGRGMSLEKTDTLWIGPNKVS